MIQVATFDCYGTLIDWEGGAAGFLYELARRHEREPPPAGSCASAGRSSNSTACRGTTTATATS